MGILSVVLTLAFTTIHRCHQNSLDLRRNAADIELVLKAGERWREDVRTATASPRIVEDGGAFVIPRKDGEVVYHWADGIVWRQSGSEKKPVLKAVKTSRMLSDARQHVRAWRWELELASPQRVVRVRPLFSFQAAKTTKE